MTLQDRDLDTIRQAMRANLRPDEAVVLRHLIETVALDDEARMSISARAADLVRAVRSAGSPGLMQSFLTEYGLSTREGVALMCLAEALLRVPDDETIDALIEDKIAPSAWARHLGQSSSPLVNASTWALMLTGRVLDESGEGLAKTLRGAVKRLGEPVIRTAVGQAMREMGRQFVLGRDIGEAMGRAEASEARGFSYSYDMLGEAARTDHDARQYLLHYATAISHLASACTSADIRENPGISAKLSALSPRYETTQRARVLDEIVPRVKSLAHLAAAANMGFNIDAEEQDRLDLSLDIIEQVLAEPAFRGWNGFGVVVQAYGPRAPHVIDWLGTLARRLDRRIMVRLVKGAYWDTEIKHAQEQGLAGFPVFTRKVTTDVCYLACARKLLAAADRIYPQFATHNAHTVMAVRHMAESAGNPAHEFQKLHGMGDELYAEVMKEKGARCRVYAPVGAHRDLLAYLVRRLLENGANSSFVHQIVDPATTPETIARDPVTAAIALESVANRGIADGLALFGTRRNSRGWDLSDPQEIARIESDRSPYRGHRFDVEPILAGTRKPAGPTQAIVNPANHQDRVGTVRWADSGDVDHALSEARAAAGPWAATPAGARAAILRRAADLYEAQAPMFFAVAPREAGKMPADVIAEIREAVDFLRFYADEAERLAAAGTLAPRGVIACISPWNFPLAIFTGQIAAALAAGNAVIAKPAEQTPLIGGMAVALMHEAGVPRGALQYLPGDGPTVGAALTHDPRLDGVAFTGSTQTGRRIEQALAAHNRSYAMLIAETGGLNAMIVDSTALPEQAVRDAVTSAFQSAGQRCSAARILYVQEDVADRVIAMLQGAMDALVIGDPWSLSTDVGPVIDAEARDAIEARIAAAAAEGRLIKRLALPRGLAGQGTYVAPALIRAGSIADVGEEIFGPVLHVVSWAAGELDTVIEAINGAGYGLTLGLHTRIDDRVQYVIDRVRVGNAYVNRNQIGAIVGSQPFGGEGLSGTGPKAGGPSHVQRFCLPAAMALGHAAHPSPTHAVPALSATQVATLLDRLAMPEHTVEPVTLPGPTGESNRLRHVPRGRILCLGPGADAIRAQIARVAGTGNAALVVAHDAGQFETVGAASLHFIDGTVAPRVLTELPALDAVAHDGPEESRVALRQALAARQGPIVPLLSAADPDARWCLERHVCIDTTAAGGNATLLAAAGGG
ncbi:MAG: bifunctional proline dehydrogenase/L-glutamate gamma-semialdehyde dehydrogenase PutA [Pseudomonadota bacterium]